MPERIFPILEGIDLIVQTYDDGLSQRLMDTEATPKPGSLVDFDGATVTFEGSFIRRGEPATEALLFALDADDHGDIGGLVTWLIEHLTDQPLASVETRHGLVELNEADIQNALEELLTRSEA